MAETKTPVCQFGWRAPDLNLMDTDGKIWRYADVRGKKASLIIFMCNHCPYVKAILDELLEDIVLLQQQGVGVAGICSNDAAAYPDDSFEEMKKLAKMHHFSFPYLHDVSQTVARQYGAVCTPDFFGFNEKDELQYRGRHSATRVKKIDNAAHDLRDAMEMIVKTQRGPQEQQPSLGCSIKWKD